MNMMDALNEAARKARGANCQIGSGRASPNDGIGNEEMIRRREAARLGSSRLLDRLNAYQGKAA